MRERELGIFASRYTKSNIAEISNDLKNSGWQVTHYQESDDLGKISSRIQSLMVVGGDGTLRLVISSLYKEKIDLPVIVFPGGTCNSFYRALAENKTSISKEDISKEMDYSRFKPFKPGLLGSELFIVDVGIGQCEPMIGVVNENLRNCFDIGQFRPRLAGLASWLAQIGKDYNDLPPFDLYSVSSFFGTQKVFPEQDLFGDSITHALVEAKSKQQAIHRSFWAFFALGSGNIALSRIFLDCQRESCFRTDYPISSFRIGGDTVRLENEAPSGTIVQREERPILVSAFSSLPKKLRKIARPTKA